MQDGGILAVGDSCDSLNNLISIMQSAGPKDHKVIQAMRHSACCFLSQSLRTHCGRASTPRRGQRAPIKVGTLTLSTSELNFKGLPAFLERNSI